MCVIIHKPKGVKLKTKILKKAWNYNPDGSGFAVRKDHTGFTVRKGFMEFDKFIKAYNNATDQGQEAIIHFRIATHGTVIPSNCHPFHNGDQSLIMFHNGVVSAYGSTDLSDTKDLFKSIIINIPPKARHKVLSSYATGNRFVLIEGGNVSRFGTWENKHGCMWSNLNHDRAYAYNYPSAKGRILTDYDDDLDDLYWNKKNSGQGRLPLRSSYSATNADLLNDEDLGDMYPDGDLEFAELFTCDSCETDFEGWRDDCSWEGNYLCDVCMEMVCPSDLNDLNEDIEEGKGNE